MTFFGSMMNASWQLLLESAVYMIFGLLVSGLLRVFLNPNTVVRHLGQGRFRSVFKAALLGVPIPLCSCGVLPAAVSLKKQGANSGAVTAFLISTPESGVDSIAITYALLDPIMTIVRPVVAFITGAVAGIAENLLNPPAKQRVLPDQRCPVDACCDGVDCAPEVHRQHHFFTEKIIAGLRFAKDEVWEDISAWFFIGLLVAGFITVLIPEESLHRYAGGGLPAMLIMLAVGIPLYICATASTPIAAALILKGVSPGAALVFLLAGPATNVTSLTVLFGVLGKQATALYFITISVCAVVFGLTVDHIYSFFGVSARAWAAQTTETIPYGVRLVCAVGLLFFSVKPIAQRFKDLIHNRIPGKRPAKGTETDHQQGVQPGANCSGPT